MMMNKSIKNRRNAKGVHPPTAKKVKVNSRSSLLKRKRGVYGNLA